MYDEGLNPTLLKEEVSLDALQEIKDAGERRDANLLNKWCTNETHPVHYAKAISMLPSLGSMAPDHIANHFLSESGLCRLAAIKAYTTCGQLSDGHLEGLSFLSEMDSEPDIRAAAREAIFKLLGGESFKGAKLSDMRAVVEALEINGFADLDTSIGTLSNVILEGRGSEFTHDILLEAGYDISQVNNLIEAIKTNDPEPLTWQ